MSYYNSTFNSNENNSSGYKQFRAKTDEKGGRVNSNVQHLSPKENISDTLLAYKREIAHKINAENYDDAILTINKCISISRQFYGGNHPFIIELIYTLAECCLNLNDLDGAKGNLEKLLELTESSSNSSVLLYAYKSIMLLGSIYINLGEYNNALKCYVNLSGKTLSALYSNIDYNVKLAAVYLNIAVCYIHLNNRNLSEKYIKKGLGLTQGILGSDVIHKLNADLFENLGVVLELQGKFNDALIYFKKSLKLKYKLYGAENDEVLELQYKISCAYLSLSLYRESEEILNSVVETVLKSKINSATQETIYRYAAYFYTYGVVLIKIRRSNMAKLYLSKSREIMGEILDQRDTVLTNISKLINLCEYK